MREGWRIDFHSLITAHLTSLRGDILHYEPWELSMGYHGNSCCETSGSDIIRNKAHGGFWEGCLVPFSKLENTEVLWIHSGLAGIHWPQSVHLLLLVELNVWLLLLEEWAIKGQRVAEDRQHSAVVWYNWANNTCYPQTAEVPVQNNWPSCNVFEAVVPNIFCLWQHKTKESCDPSIQFANYLPVVTGSTKGWFFSSF